MKHSTPLNRPARAAIAAVLASASTPVLAQFVPADPSAQPPGAQPPSATDQAAPVQAVPVLPALDGNPARPSSPPVAAPFPAATDPASPTPAANNAAVEMAPAQAVVQPLPPEPEAQAAPAPKAPATAVKATPEPAAQPQPAAKAPADVAASEAAPDDQPLLSLPIETEPVEAVPLDGPAALPLPTVDLAPVPAADEPAVAELPPIDPDMAWVIGTGGLALLASAGLLATRRRRKRARYPRQRVLAPAMMASAPSQPSIASQELVPEPRPTPVLTPTPIQRGSRWPQLEAMVAEPPSADNPFLTRRKRMRRAKFILAHGVPRPMVPEQVVETAPARAPVAAQVARARPVYDLGPAKPAPRQGWKPATA